MNPTATLAELATTHPGAASVFYRHGLDFCCGGRRSLAEACGARGLDPATVLADVEREAAVSEHARRWDLEPLPDLIEYIIEVYHQRLRETLPDLIRMAAKRAFSGPLVPRRQLSVRQGAAASVFSAETDFASGTWFLRGRPRPETGKTRATSTG